MERYSVTQFAKILGITRQGVRKAIIENRLQCAYKVGNQWIVEPTEEDMAKVKKKKKKRKSY